MGNTHHKKDHKARSPRPNPVSGPRKAVLSGPDTLGCTRLFREQRFHYGPACSAQVVGKYRLQALDLAYRALEAVCVELCRTNFQPPLVDSSLHEQIKAIANETLKDTFSTDNLESLTNGCTTFEDHFVTNSFGRLPPVNPPIESPNWGPFETTEVKITPKSSTSDVTVPPLFLINGGLMSPAAVQTKLREMGENISFLFWVFDSTKYCVPNPEDPARMQLAEEVEEFLSFLKSYFDADENAIPEGCPTIIAVFNNKDACCKLLDTTSITVCWPALNVTETNTNNGLDVLRAAMKHAMPQSYIHKYITESSDVGSQKFFQKVAQLVAEQNSQKKR